MNKTLRPNIIFAHRVMRAFTILLPVFIFFSLISLCVSNAEEVRAVFIFFGLIAFIIFTMTYLSATDLKKTTYTLSPDYITTNYSCWHSCSTTICYKDIREIALNQGIFQRKFDIGSITIITSASIDGSNSGFKIYDISNYQEIYDFLIRKMTESNK